MNKPLAHRMRPETLEEVIGMDELVGENKILSNIVKQNQMINIVFFGNPGCGKTTLANALCNSLNVNKFTINATNTSKSEMIEIFEKAKNLFPSVVIIDEIHQLDKAKQNILLPLLEEGSFYIIGTTTSNPLISLNNAIRSRVHLIEVKPLNKKNVITGIKRAIKHENGLDDSRTFSEECIDYIAGIAGGDLRFALNIVETLALSHLKDEIVSLADVKNLKIVPNYLSDKDENEHYDTLSAFQKSIRGSDVDASLFYLAKLIRTNDLESIIRRLIVISYEDVGLGNPNAVSRTYQACCACRDIGFPEARIILSFVVIDLCLSPKSKSAEMSIDKALDSVDKNIVSVRDYLKYTPVNRNKEECYPYDEPIIWRHLVYLPEGMENETFYTPPMQVAMYEKSLLENYKKLKSEYHSTSIKELRKRYSLKVLEKR